MKKYIILLLFVQILTAHAQEVGVEVEERVEVQKIIEHAGLTREEIALTRTRQDYYVINDIISEETIFVSLDKTMEYFVKSLEYYNRALAIETKKAILKARKNNKRYYVNIVGGSDIPEHRFGTRNNVYKVEEFTNGQHTVFYVEPNGRIFKDHYESGDYGQLGRDGVSFEHSVKTFGASEIRKAVKRAVESNKNFDWEVTVKLPDQNPQMIIFDTYEKYEEWFNRKRFPDNYAEVKKVKNNLEITRK